MHPIGIIGLGSIAAMYGQPDDPGAYCHVGGILHSDRVRLRAVADLDPEVTGRFRQRWGESFPDLVYHDSAASMLEAGGLDVVAVCVRGPYHFPVMRDVLAAEGVKAVFLEKPPVCSLAEQDEMVALAAQRNIPVTVSYSRHWGPQVLRMQELIADGLIGEVKQVTAWTGGPALSFASHSTDLICQFLGYDPVAVRALGRVPGPDAERPIPDGYEPEPAIESMILEYGDGRTGYQLAAQGLYSGFYAEVAGTEGHARVGVYIPPYVVKHEGNPLGGEPLDLAGYDIPAPMSSSVFTHAYEQIAAHLDGGPSPHCTGPDWHTVNEVGFAAIESIHAGGERVTLPNARRDRKVFANG